MLIKILEFLIDAATLIFILGAGMAVGRFFSMFTGRVGELIKDKLSDNVYSVISIIFSLLIIALVLYEVFVN